MQCAGKGVGRLVGMEEGGLVGWVCSFGVCSFVVFRLPFVVYRLPFSVVRQRRGAEQVSKLDGVGFVVCGLPFSVCRLSFVVTVYRFQLSVREEG